MIKVKNSPGSYVKRSQIRPACVVVERVAEAPKKRTAADFRNAVMDGNFYVTFSSDPQPAKRK
ncbi:hypothetical protein HFO97_27250 [Rhizobium leguminosarum]|uniref:hypothetical protein n=1 Tax=Rhizobium leguminosarum TaxID=384 RepID=UPI001C9887B5|nr:hypothetical protein [Rhizobium leguminosarum]MBY5363579.1 hypothetical protein [Rhizobium leguminosarum]